MDDWRWKKRQLLVSQLEFFGCKKINFISEYAKKPRILMVNKAEVLTFPLVRELVGVNQLSALYQEQCNRGMQNSSRGYEQMAMTSMAANGMGQAQFAGGLGGLGGLVGQLTGGRFI